MPIVIRPAVLADVPIMMALASRAATAAQWTAKDYEDLFRPDVVRRHSLVLEEKGVVQAFIVARQMQQVWVINIIASAAIARGTGPVTRLLVVVLTTHVSFA